MCSFVEFRLQYSSLALLYYDYALTLPKEVRYVWKQRFRLSTALYICCRYALVANILYLLAVAEKCDLWYKLISALSVLGRTAVTAVFCIRTNAVWGNNRWILACMSILGVICIVVDIAHVPGSRCVGSQQNQTITLVSKMLNIMVVLFESTSAILTVARCLIAFRTGGGLAQQRHGFMFIIFEQGQIRHLFR
ncbi:hypothetical protein B0H13DRAFT_1640336 [Mycena leptocephala]|nr:hypothetical protein B0H13DRAFT_1640336 [Mycena leptocephala]